MKTFFGRCGKVVNVILVKPKFDLALYMYGYVYGFLTHYLYQLAWCIVVMITPYCKQKLCLQFELIYFVKYLFLIKYPSFIWFLMLVNEHRQE